jgi:5-methylcytosine-specific restriction endonuclease McrA
VKVGSPLGSSGQVPGSTVTATVRRAGTDEPATDDHVAPFTRRAGKALVLNATMEPLCVVPARRAVVLVLSSKADVVQTNGHRFRSEHLDISAPSVVRLRSFVRVPYRRRAALSRRGVFIRDGHLCQYCDRTAENVDHVIPRSRGGAHEWENVVAACRRCNSRKKDRTPAEAAMELRRQPYAPRAAFWLVVAVGGVREDWEMYLGDVLSAG